VKEEDNGENEIHYKEWNQFKPVLEEKKGGKTFRRRGRNGVRRTENWSGAHLNRNHNIGVGLYYRFGIEKKENFNHDGLGNEIPIGG